MKISISDKENIEKLIQYYKEKGLLIVGLNDSQGVNVTPTFFKKGLLEYLANVLTSDELTPEVINAFSLTMNKTEHIDYFLKSNLSLEEIKLSQVYSAVSAFEKVMTDIGLPKGLGKIGNVYKLIYKINPLDWSIKITSSLKYACEPVVIYSSGVNNLMREVGSNPFGIKKDYKERNKKPNFNYTLEKAKYPKTLRIVMDGVERNYENILSINPKTDIFTLGAYIPKSLQIEAMNVFRDLVIEYNEKLKDLCNQYGTTFVNTEEIGKKYNNSSNNFHISTKGHNALANYILSCMYEKKILSKNSENSIIGEKFFDISNDGAEGVVEDTLDDYRRSCAVASVLRDYPKKRELAIAEEHKREKEIFEKVLSNKTR